MNWKLYEFDYQTETAFKIVDEKEVPVGLIVGQNHIEGDIDKKREIAQLIAAAPDLLKATELSLDFFKNCREDICGREENIEYIEEAINKAKFGVGQCTQ